MNDSLEIDNLKLLCDALLHKAAKPSSRQISPLKGGRNNRVFHVWSEQDQYLLKIYFHHPDDPRDRLKHEFSFLQHVYAKGSRRIAEPIAESRSDHAALTRFIEGVQPPLHEIGVYEIEQAIDFYHEINEKKEVPSSQTLPAASEACFSIQEHLEMTQKRVDRLQKISQKNPENEEALLFVQNELRPTWEIWSRRIQDHYPIINNSLDLHERVISPSDFGYHNSIRKPDRNLCFVDFEFAGWDDPAKLACDFANQPDMLLDDALSQHFIQAVCKTHPRPDELADRIQWLEPLYQIKWSCICLNEFLDWGEKRSGFSQFYSYEKSRKPIQLKKAKEMYQRALAKIGRI